MKLVMNHPTRIVVKNDIVIALELALGTTALVAATNIMEPRVKASARIRRIILHTKVFSF